MSSPTLPLPLPSPITPQPSPIFSRARWRIGPMSAIAANVMVSGPSPIPSPVKSDPRAIVRAPAIEWISAEPSPPNIFHVWELRNELWQRVGSLEHDELRGLWMPTRKVWVWGAGKGIGGRVEVEEWTLNEEERKAADVDLGGVYWWRQHVDADFPTPSTPSTPSVRDEPWMIHTNYLNDIPSPRMGLLVDVMEMSGKGKSVFDEMQDACNAMMQGSTKLSSTPWPSPAPTPQPSSSTPSPPNASPPSSGSELARGPAQAPTSNDSCASTSPKTHERARHDTGSRLT